MSPLDLPVAVRVGGCHDGAGRTGSTTGMLLPQALNHVPPTTLQAILPPAAPTVPRPGAGRPRRAGPPASSMPSIPSIPSIPSMPSISPVPPGQTVLGR